MSKLKNIRIFCEGVSDQRFLRDFIKLNYKIEITDAELKKNKYIHNLSGYTNLKNLQNKITEELSDYKSLIFLDADDTRVCEKAGKQATDNFIDDLMKSWNWDQYDKYVFPNNQKDGEVEDFFENIININHSKIFDCWEQLQNCLSTNDYSGFPKKSKIYFYHDVLLSDKDKCKDSGRDFTNKNLWTIDFNKNEYLSRLKSFLDQYLL